VTISDIGIVLFFADAPRSYTTSTVYVSSTTVSVSISIVTNSVYTILGNDFYQAPTVKVRDVAVPLVSVRSKSILFSQIIEF
jgi:hypothetical protein